MPKDEDKRANGAEVEQPPSDIQRTVVDHLPHGVAFMESHPPPTRPPKKDEAIRLLEYALTLCMYGEDAPGGNETWRQFAVDCEHFLRGQAETAEAETLSVAETLAAEADDPETFRSRVEAIEQAECTHHQCYRRDKLRHAGPFGLRCSEHWIEP